nr:hypothetical protein CFP56_11215 [Quercus suber]
MRSGTGCQSRSCSQTWTAHRYAIRQYWRSPSPGTGTVKTLFHLGTADHPDQSASPAVPEMRWLFVFRSMTSNIDDDYATTVSTASTLHAALMPNTTTNRLPCACAMMTQHQATKKRKSCHFLVLQVFVGQYRFTSGEVVLYTFLYSEATGHRSDIHMSTLPASLPRRETLALHDSLARFTLLQEGLPRCFGIPDWPSDYSASLGSTFRKASKATSLVSDNKA